MSNTTKTYTPQAGTMGARALLALAASETGRMSNAVLLEAMGQPPGYAGMTNVMDNCVFYKLVETDKDAFNRFWTITEQGRETAARMLANQKRTEARHDDSEADLAPPSAPQPFTEATDEGHLVAADSDDDIECALTSSGRLIIDANGVKQALSKQQTNQLLEYVDRMRGIVWEEGAA